MVEKKLTDEEIVKAWEYCLNKDTTCENCPYDKTNYCAISTEEIIDLIHRLQVENAEYKRKLDDGELVSTEWHNEQVMQLHNEIEELRNAKVIYATVDYCYEDLKEAQAEIERLTEELRSKTKEFEITEKVFIKNVEENIELKKQVDELKERLHMIFALGFDYDGCDKAESLKGLIDELVKITQMDSKEFAEYYKGVEVE